MTRDEALKLLKRYLKNKNLFNHCLAVEAIMRGVARRFDEDEEEFGLAGLLHDIDYDSTANDLSRHSLVGSEMLAQEGLPPEIVYAVKVHNDAHGLERKSLLDKALYAADPVSGFIVAAALIRPEKKLEVVDVDFLLNRFKEKSFARGARREQMAACEEFGMSLPEFLELSLRSMQAIAPALGL
ncbi:MAG TPA: HDIG domain-containing protein [Syntrophothermus lipocalidus]|uniref:HD domain-containing protein n=1 Tax=Syntrophothermus sp. TaxID=2736299 RepID=UPI002579CB6C|nr:HD domain-containing protein [Syntrophothermus sp.]NSW84066.1 HDIG domain-containing protein [Syntrophothermus sp.]HOV43264.1 HDIG domain-containing protein [Syntrophothermus lipocalidus]